MSDYLDAHVQLMDTGIRTLIRSPDDVMNELMPRDPTMAVFLGGRDNEKLVRPGPRIRWDVLLEQTKTWGRYKDGEKKGIVRQGGTELCEVPFAKSYARLTYTESEALLIDADGRSEDAAERLYRSAIATKKAQLWSDIAIGMQTDFLAQPNYESMELASEDDRDPYSLFSLINEFEFGLFRRGQTISGGPSEWTQKFGKNPALYEDRFTPLVHTYDASAPFTPDADVNSADLVSAATELMMRLRFVVVPIPEAQDHVQPQARMESKKILTSERGRALMSSANFARGDRQRAQGSGEAADPATTLRGLEIHGHPDLDTVEVYPGGSGSNSVVNEASATAAGARFYFLDTDYMGPCFHEQRYFKMEDPEWLANGHVAKSEAYQDVKVWQNFICESFRRQGILKPAA